MTTLFALIAAVTGSAAFIFSARAYYNTEEILARMDGGPYNGKR